MTKKLIKNNMRRKKETRCPSLSLMCPDERDCELCEELESDLTINNVSGKEKETRKKINKIQKRYNIKTRNVYEKMCKNVNMKDMLREVDQEIEDNIQIYRLWYEYRKRYDPMVILLRVDLKKNPHLINYYKDKKRCLENTSFKIWLEQKKEAQVEKKIRDKFKPKAVRNYSDIVKDEIETCIAVFEACNGGKEPSLDEFKDLFAQYLEDNITLTMMVGVSFSSNFFDLCAGGHDAVICVNVIGENDKDIKKQFNEIIKQTKKKVALKRWVKSCYKEPFTWASNKPNFNKIINELKRYLEVYDINEKYKGKLKQKDVVKNYYSKIMVKYGFHDDSNYQRTFSIDLNKAKKLIENAYRGNFPGYYQPKKQEK